MRVRGLEQREMDIWERIGTRMLAQAVLEATSVRKVETKAMMKLTRRGSRLWKYSSHSEPPSLCLTDLETVQLEDDIFGEASLPGGIGQGEAASEEEDDAPGQPLLHRVPVQQGGRGLLPAELPGEEEGEGHDEDCRGGAVDPGLGGRISLGQTIEHLQVSPACSQVLYLSQETQSWIYSYNNNKSNS